MKAIIRKVIVKINMKMKDESKKTHNINKMKQKQLPNILKKGKYLTNDRNNMT